MSNLCSKLITQCIAADCSNPIFSGINGVGYIFNKEEIDSITYSQTNPNLITNITMKTYQDGSDDVAYTGYKIQMLGKQPFENSTISMTEGTIMNRFTENVQFSVSDNSATASNLIDSLANGKFLVILHNDYVGSDGNGEWQVFGAAKGLSASAIERDPYSDLDGAWQCTLTQENGPKSSVFIHHETTPGTDDTESFIESLVSCE